ncbi:MAG TPA: hypothetical protein VMZ28_11535 [Kofleriaceae bacterium]|nr:hypothetical protein [Kofleriaceae bacterium]
MRARPLLVVVLLATLAATGAAHAGSSLPPIDRYFSAAELRLSHPGQSDRVYHGVEHSLDVRRFAHELARGRGLSEGKARFLSEVGLLHDWDPRRKPGTPARVGATLAALDADFAGREPLVPGTHGSILRARFGWSARDLEVAKALIQRTTFPFDDAAAGVYEDRLRALDPADQRFVLQEGALLSEYADKASTYTMRSVERVRRATRGLASEINRQAGRRVMTAARLDPASFLESIGARANFAADHAIGRRLGLRVRFPTRDRVFARLPASHRIHFEATLRASRAGVRPPRRATASSRPVAVRAGELRGRARGRAPARRLVTTSGARSRRP